MSANRRGRAHQTALDDVDELRAGMLLAGRRAGALLSDEVSTKFLASCGREIVAVLDIKDAMLRRCLKHIELVERGDMSNGRWLALQQLRHDLGGER